jgi:hypothetical protein
LQTLHHRNVHSVDLPFTWARMLRLIILVPVLLPAQTGSRTASMPVIDMHFHTMWLGPNMTSRRTGFPSGETPEEMHRRNVAALDRNHIVRAVASGDQLPLYASLVGGRLIPGLSCLALEKNSA